MNDRVLGADEIEKMQTPLWEQAKAAIDAGDSEAAKALVDRAVAQWASLKDYSINWITTLLTFIADELGEEAVETALRKTGDDFVRPRRSGERQPRTTATSPVEASERDHDNRATGRDWGDLPAAQRAKVIARSMLGNMGEVEVDEDDEKIILSFRCGSGGKLIDDGRYEGEHAYRVLREAAGRTFTRDELWVYCAHCSVNNEIQPIEWGESPTSIEYPPTRPGERCVHHIYKDVAATPADAFRRVGKEPPDAR
jgi:hypothetical protein